MGFDHTFAADEVTPSRKQTTSGSSWWEFAARGGLDGRQFAWGGALTPDGRHMANTWQGNFPIENLNEDGYEPTSPVTAFLPNGYGVQDIIGNIWEWTADWWSIKHEADTAKACCVPQNPRGGTKAASLDPCQPNIRIPRKVLKGGSHLCAPNYCRRSRRPACRTHRYLDQSCWLPLCSAASCFDCQT